VTAEANPWDVTRWDLVSWDVDGTLYSMPAVKRAVIRRALLGLFSFRIVRNIREFSSLGRFRKQMAAVRDAGGALPEDALAGRDSLLEAERRWYGPAIGKVGLAPGVLALMAAFDDAGVPQVVVSDYVADYKLAALGLSGRFERAYAGETVGQLKPSPELFRVLLAEHDVDPARVLHIGDRDDTDGIAARTAGCQVVIIGEQFATAQHLLEAVERKQLGS